MNDAWEAADQAGLLDAWRAFVQTGLIRNWPQERAEIVYRAFCHAWVAGRDALRRDDE